MAKDTPNPFATKPSQVAEGNGGFFSGLVGGATTNPFVQLPLSAVLDEDTLRNLQAKGRGSFGGEIGRFVGEFGPDVAAMLPLYRAGQLAGRSALIGAGSRVGTVGAVKNLPEQFHNAARVGLSARKLKNLDAAVSETAGAGNLALLRERIGRDAIIEKVRDRLSVLGLKGSAKLTPKKAFQDGLITKDEMEQLVAAGFKSSKPIVDGGFGLGGKSGLVRGFEIGGGNLAIAAYEGTREAARAVFEGDDFDGVARNAAITFVLGAGLEGGITTLGRSVMLRADLGVLDALPLAAQRRLGLVDDNLRSTLPSRRNPFGGFAPKATSSPEFRQFKERLKTIAHAEGSPTATEIAAIEEDGKAFVGQLNRLFTEYTLARTDGRRRVLGPAIGKDLTVKDVKRMLKKAKPPRNADEFLEQLGVKFEPKLDKRGRRNTRGLQKMLREEFKPTFANLNNVILREERIKQLLTSNPHLVYLSRFPATSGANDASLQRLLLQTFVTPEGFQSKLGLGWANFFNGKGGMRDTDQLLVASRDAAQGYAGSVEREVADILGFKPKQVRPKRNVKNFKREQPGSGLAHRLNPHKKTAAFPDGVPIFLDITHSLEIAGDNADVLIATLMREVVKADGSKLNIDEATRMSKALLDMMDVVENGRFIEALDSVTGKVIRRQITKGTKDLQGVNPKFRTIEKKTLEKQTGSRHARYFPRHDRMMSAEERDEIFRANMSEEEYAAYNSGAQKWRDAHALPYAASIDFHRTKLKGTIRDIIEADPRMASVYNLNPFEAFASTHTEVNRRFHMGNLFGHTDDQVSQTIKMVRQMVAEENRFANKGILGGRDETYNKGAANLAHDMMNIMVGRSYEDTAHRALASFFTSYNVLSKLTLGVLPNIFQSGQTVTFNGWTNYFKGVKTALSKESRDMVHVGVGNAEGMLDIMGFATGDRPFINSPGLLNAMANFMQASAEGTLRYTQFQRVESWNRTTAASSGWWRGVELVSKAAQLVDDNRRLLVGNQLEFARRQAKMMGFDLDEVAAKARRAGYAQGPNGEPVLKWFNSKEGIEWSVKTMFRSAEATQFIPSDLRRPSLWSHPYGRVIFQFKTFALQQFRFMRDVVAKELAEGNVRPAAYFLGIAPVAGEVVGDLKAYFRNGSFQRDETGIDRFISNALYMGGAGMMSDLIRAARMEQFAEALLGPTPSDVIGWIEQLSRLNARGFGRDVSRLPLAQVGRLPFRALVATGEVTKDSVDSFWNVVRDESDGARGSGFSISSGSLNMNKRNPFATQ